MMKKRIFLACLAFVAILPAFGCRQKPMEIDATENLKIAYSGFNEEATAEVESNEIEYDKKDETIARLIKSFEYDISPDKGLKNGDKVTVEVKYEKNLEELANVELVNLKKEFTVSGLHGDQREQVVKEEKTEEGDTILKSYDVIDGVEIPSEWKMTEKEKEEYLDYLDSIGKENGMTQESGGNEAWKQGIAENTTKRKDTTFYIEEYKDAITTYDAAEEFGKYSSQEYRIEQVMEDDELIGYRCIFKDE